MSVSVPVSVDYPESAPEREPEPGPSDGTWDSEAWGISWISGRERFEPATSFLSDVRWTVCGSDGVESSGVGHRSERLESGAGQEVESGYSVHRFLRSNN